MLKKVAAVESSPVKSNKVIGLTYGFIKMSFIIQPFWYLICIIFWIWDLSIKLNLRQLAFFCQKG